MDVAAWSSGEGARGVRSLLTALPNLELKEDELRSIPDRGMTMVDINPHSEKQVARLLTGLEMVQRGSDLGNLLD